MTLRDPKIGLLAALAALAGCGDWVGDQLGQRQQPLVSKCTIQVVGKGLKDMENDYLPRVITCENGAADFEALKAQAVAARSYAYYVTRNGGSIKDGQSNQVYSCSAQPKQKHYDAVKATAGQVLRYQSKVICAFYVAGAKPSDAVGCKAKGSDSDPTNTEKYVTYNEGKSGGGITQSTLGWVSSTNLYNRGCKSQNGANCLSKAGRSYVTILRYYYGADIELYQTSGSCVTAPKDAGVPPSPDLGQPDTTPPPPPPPPTPDQGVVPPPKHDSWQPPPSPDSGIEPGPTPDLGVTVRLDSAPQLPASPNPRYLNGGCATGHAADAGAIPLLLLALALCLGRRRKRARR
jgi:hypothetical protein